MFKRLDKTYRREQPLLKDLKRFADLLDSDGLHRHAELNRTCCNDLGYCLQEGESLTEKAKVTSQLRQVFGGKDGLQEFAPMVFTSRQTNQ